MYRECARRIVLAVLLFALCAIFFFTCERGHKLSHVLNPLPSAVGVTGTLGGMAVGLDVNDNYACTVVDRLTSTPNTGALQIIDVLNPCQLR